MPSNIAVSPKALARLRHMLGIRRPPGHQHRWTKPYRNHYEAGEVTVELIELETANLVERRTDHEIVTFFALPLGEEFAKRGIIYRGKWGYDVRHGQRTGQ